MSSPTLLVAGSVSIVTGIAFAVVGRAVAQRTATNSRKFARRAHMTWWLGLGAYLVLQGALTTLAAYDALTLGSYLGSRIVTIPLLCASVWGITFYILFLYTGSTRSAMPLVLLYAFVAAVFYWATFTTSQELIVERWIITIDDSSALYRLVYVLVGIPPIAASAAYLALLRRVREPAKRYRLTLVAGSILAYVGSGLAARLSANDFVIFVTLVLFGLGAAAASLAAYYPPRRLRARLGTEAT